MIDLASPYERVRGAKIRVVGVGGGGGNAVNGMIEKGLAGVEFIAINCDLQALDRNNAPIKIQIGKNLTKGYGCGADPSIGHRAVEEDREEIARVLSGSDMVFVTAGMGGGTGTGGAPLVANIAKSIGALVVSIITRPFDCEGKKRQTQSNHGIEELKKQVDTQIVIPNQKLLSIVERTTPLIEAFAIADQVLYNATRGISELITVPGLINVDFADVRTIMREMGDALMGSGVATGEHRAIEAANSAISSPLLDGVNIAGAQGLLVNISGSKNMTLIELSEAASIVREAAGDEANVILGAVIDDTFTDEMMVTVIATGFGRKAAVVRPPKIGSNMLDRIPTGLQDLQKLDEPAYIRKGIPLSITALQVNENVAQKIDKADTEKPAFLRKIMD